LDISSANPLAATRARSVHRAVNDLIDKTASRDALVPDHAVAEADRFAVVLLGAPSQHEKIFSEKIRLSMRKGLFSAALMSIQDSPRLVHRPT
jgi:hypothetical protein